MSTMSPGGYLLLPRAREKGREKSETGLKQKNDYWNSLGVVLQPRLYFSLPWALSYYE